MTVFNFSSFSIKKKLVLPILLILLVFSFISAVSIVYTQKKRDLESLGQKSSLVSSMLMHSASEALWNLSIDTLELQSSKVFEDAEVSFLQIKNSSGEIVIEKKRENTGSDDKIIDQKIKKGDDSVGTLKLIYTSYYIEKNIRSIMFKIFLQSLAAFIVIAIIITMLIQKILKPFYELIDVFADINKGDFRNRADISSRDEIGKFAISFNAFIDSLSMTIIRTQSLSKTVSVNSNLITKTMNEIVMDDLKDNGDNSKHNIQLLKNGMDSMMQNITEQSVSTEETSAAVVEISETIKGVAKNVSLIKDLSIETDADASNAVQIVQDTLERLRKVDEVVKSIETKAEKLDKSSKKIGEILSVISEIAEQTNLLSLNAAIEAARAGEAGKGFAIVADEIQKLSGKTNDATNEIDGLVREIQSEVKEVVETSSIGYLEVNKSLSLSEKASGNLQHVLDSISKIGSEISNITNSTSEQSITMEEISTSIEEIAEKSSTIQIMADTQSMGLDNIVTSLEGLETSSEEMTNVSNKLDEIFNSFKLNELK